MLNKKIMLLAIFLVSLLAVSAVSAQDNATGDIASVNDLTDMNEGTLQESPSDDIELSNSSNPGTFTALKTKIESAAEGSTVTLENDYVYDSGFGTEPISISKQLTIDGKGHTIDADSKTSVFLLNAEVTLKNITFIHCLGQYGGTVAIWASNCEIDSCNFIDCNGLSEYGIPKEKNWGGGIYNLGSNCNIKSCNFINCTTYNGGGIYTSASNCKITSCSFTNCHVPDQGGAISNDVECEIDSCNFTNCGSDNKGGAIFNAGQTNAESCIFTNCSAYNGNAIYNQAGSSKAKNCKFPDLTQSQAGNAEFTDCTFKDSSSPQQVTYKIDVVENSILVDRNDGDYYQYEHIAYVTIPAEVSKGKFAIIDNGKEICTMDLVKDASYWDTYGSEQYCTVFLDNLNLNGVKDGDLLRFAFLDGNGTEVIGQDYFICFVDKFIKFEIDDGSVEKIDPNVSINVEDSDYGSVVLVEIITNETFSGEVTVQIENGIYPVTVKNGVGNTTVSNLNSKNYVAYAVFKSTRLFKESKVNDTFKVNPIDSSIDINDTVFIDYGSLKNIDVITNGATGFVAKIDGNDVEVSGNVVVLSGLDVGDHILSVTTIPDDNHNAVTKNVTITVKEKPIPTKTDSSITILNTVSMYYGSSVNVDVTTAGATGFVAKIDGNDVEVSGNVVVLSGLDVGDHILSVTTIPDDGHNAVTKNVTITVKEKPIPTKTDSSITIKNAVSMNYGTSLNVDVAIANATGFVAKIDGKDATIQGNAVVVSGLSAGNHILTVTTIVDDSHNAVTKNVTITVNKLKTVVKSSASKVTVAYGTSKNIIVTLMDGNGALLANKKVTITINNKPYSGITKDNGQASIAIPKPLAVKSYPSTITFAGDSVYAKSTASVQVVVIKATPKLAAAKKTYKRTVKIKSYTVTLKTNLNAPLKSTAVTLNVNKKNYVVRTNAKGQATFKINNLNKKGNFKATVKFAGSAYYTARTVSTYITVR